MEKKQNISNIDDQELTVLSHILKHYLSTSSENEEVEGSLAMVNAEIENLCQREKMSKWKSWILLSSVVLVAVVVTCVSMLYINSDSGIQRYVNSGDSSMNIGLPDGTQVWINPGTELSIDNKFNIAERRVSMTGEAYFDVAPNESCPFIVSSGKFKVKVLGTVFNVNARPQTEYPEVSLAQGSVTMQNENGVDLVKLVPGQKAVFDTHSSTVEVKDVYVGDLLLRHYGAVSLKSATISEIIAEINKVYGVQIVASDPGNMSTYNFCFQKDSDIEDVLAILRFACRNQKFILE